MSQEQDQNLASRSWPAGRWSNLAILIASFGVGQGAIFVSQSWLVTHGQIATLGIFAGHFAFSTLALVIIDLGGGRTLAYLAASEDTSVESDSMWRHYWALVIWRLILVVGATSVAVLLLIGNGSGYSARYIACCAPGYLAWCLNLTGILDGKRQSGINGIANGIPYVLTGASVMLFYESRDSLAVMTGLAFSLGLAISVALQFHTLRRAGGVTAVRPNIAEFWTAGWGSLVMLSTIAPGQVYFRLQILLCTHVLGIETTGLYLYGRQILNAVLQLVYFIWRVEFVTMTVAIRQGVLRAVRYAVPGMVVTMLVASVTLIAQWTLAGSGLGVLSFAINSVYSQLPVLLSLTAFQLFMQLTLARGMMSSLAVASLVSALSGVILSFALFFVPSLSVLIWAEVVSHLVGIALLGHALRSRVNVIRGLASR